jgi:RNA polymerase sigma-70 factor (ECF subfamily)
MSQYWPLSGHYCQARLSDPIDPPMTDRTTSLFEEQRQLLFGIAYRMLGSVTDAEDMVQETYLRWQQANDDAIRTPRAWLTTVITRLCINHLQSARVKRETYVGQWLPEPLVDERASNPADVATLADSLSLAFLVLLETLSPTERAVFILREGFDCEFADIARMVEKSEANCRQILARARQRIDERRPRYEVAPEDAEKIVAPFIAAMKTGNLEAMLARLAENVVLVADGGDKPGALLRPLEGAVAVARAMLHAARKHGMGGEIRAANVNGLPGFVRLENGHAKAVLAFGLSGGRIQQVFVISNPDKLRHLHRPAPGSSQQS